MSYSSPFTIRFVVIVWHQLQHHHQQWHQSHRLYITTMNEGLLTLFNFTNICTARVTNYITSVNQTTYQLDKTVGSFVLCHIELNDVTTTTTTKTIGLVDRLRYFNNSFSLSLSILFKASLLHADSALAQPTTPDSTRSNSMHTIVIIIIIIVATSVDFVFVYLVQSKLQLTSKQAHDTSCFSNKLILLFHFNQLHLLFRPLPRLKFNSYAVSADAIIEFDGFPTDAIINERMQVVFECIVLIASDCIKKLI